jgi:hypothetical protein
MYVRQEAVLSSQIEGIQSSWEDGSSKKYERLSLTALNTW